MSVGKLFVVALCGVMIGAGNARAAQQEAAAPTDPQIAAIVVAANQADIDVANVAKTHAKSKDVKEFANTMIRDHGAVNAQAKALVKKLKVKPEPSATSKSLASQAKEEIASLKKLKGAEFDRAYVDHEVTYHQQVIDAINSTLIPNAKNPELKALIEKAAPAFDAHLAHAKKLQSQLSSGAAAK